jgi:hypothetical protein
MLELKYMNFLILNHLNFLSNFVYLSKVLCDAEVWFKILFWLLLVFLVPKPALSDLKLIQHELRYFSNFGCIARLEYFYELKIEVEVPPNLFEL